MGHHPRLSPRHRRRHGDELGRRQRPAQPQSVGGAIGVARILAATTARHTIASSETAYELLSGQFLFRPRGSYFLPETGNMRVFVMVGRT